MYFIFIILAIATVCNGIKSSDLCRNTEMECRGSYVMNYKYKETCRLLDCYGDFPYNCSTEICSANKEMCQEFLKIRNLVSSMFRLPKDIQKYQKFYDNIKICPAREHNFDVTEVCLTGKSCLYIEKSAKISKFHVSYYSRETVCPCRGYYNYHCGEKFCTTSNLACNSITQELFISTQFLKCHNDNQVIKKKF